MEKGTTLANGQAIANSGGSTERCAWLTSDTASNPGIVGNANLTDSRWSSWTNHNKGCGELHHLYCFEQP